jgi:hypothetical protein
MRNRARHTRALTLTLTVSAPALVGAQALSQIPPVWDAEHLEGFLLPLVHAPASPGTLPPEDYQRIPTAPIYESYPIYPADREPPGYLGSLARAEPAIAFDSGSLKTEADWVRAGRLVFESQLPPFFPIEVLGYVRRPELYGEGGIPVTKEGVMPFMRYVVREKGRVEIGVGCAFCHVRVLDDGTLVPGAPGNYPIARDNARILRGVLARAGGDRAPILERLPFLAPGFWRAPWLDPDPTERLAGLPPERWPDVWESFPTGVLPRHTGMAHPAVIPDLIGVEGRRYLERTGYARHRSIGDLMRYAALVTVADRFTGFGEYVQPALRRPEAATRYSDVQLYALARYIYSLRPPPNPNPETAETERGRAIFFREGCDECHTPPLYTSNSLVAAPGFEVPEADRRSHDILSKRVDTDPGMTTRTRRGTGYYKVPSLRGVWYRGPFGHSGSAARLEDWFDRRRLREDWVPTGFRGYGVRSRAVPGHRFGLDLAAVDKAALVAFLRSL